MRHRSAPPAAAEAPRLHLERGGRACRALAALACAALAAWLPAHAADESPAAPADSERVQVADPFIELRTGPGRGYPVFHVEERLAWITIELRRTDWFRVRTESAQGGRVGWVHRSQLEHTLTEAGSRKSFRDIVVDDYLRRRVEMGAAWGRFRSEPMLKLWGMARTADTLGVELAAGQVQGTFSGSDFWHVALVSEPWSDRRLSPFLSFGVGRFRNIPNPSLVGAATTHANLGHAGVGLRWHVTERFVARLDWSIYATFVSDQRSLEYRAVTAGVAFFF